MMRRFWLATWDAPATPDPPGPMVAPLASTAARRLAIEVLQEDDRLVVLLSAADRLAASGTLACLVGFCNSAPDSSTWRSHGFPVVDAAIRLQGGLLEVSSPFFGNGKSMRYDERLLSVQGVVFDAAAAGGGLPLAASYDQCQEGPDPDRPASRVLRRKVEWRVTRGSVKELAAAPLTIRMPAARSPDLRPLRDGPLAITHAWSGTWTGEPVAAFSAQQPDSVPRHHVFGAPAFRFEQVELLGFRIRLQGQDLNPLVAPLNPRPGEPPPGFRFRAQEQQVLVHLLRYGRMRLAGDPQPPLDQTDFQSQHELVVRVTAGRVPDGELDVLDEAVHVPAIFVDNPWSKILGRDLQGFEKCLADFSVRDAAGQLVRLRPDGQRAGGGGAAQLSDVVRVCLVGLVSGDAAPSPRVLLEIELERLDEDGDDAIQIQGGPPGPLPGDGLEEFAVQGVPHGIDEFRSIQATPVDDRRLGKAWISATCQLSDRAEEKGQAAIARLTFHALDGAPRGWTTLCRLLGAPPGGQVSLDLDPGEWFRSRFSMDLTAHDE